MEHGKEMNAAWPRWAHVKGSNTGCPNQGKIRGGEMAPDYDLSYLPNSEVELRIYLQAELIVGQIMADQADRLGYPRELGDCMVSAMTSQPQGLFNNG
jgi:hypothetical protein